MGIKLKHLDVYVDNNINWSVNVEEAHALPAWSQTLRS